MAQHYDYYIVLDFEATCTDAQRPEPGYDKNKQEIIEWPMVVLRVGAGGGAGAGAPVPPPAASHVSEFHAYVRPVHNPRLMRFCIDLTGIQQGTVDAADTFPVVWQQAMQFLSEAEDGLLLPALQSGRAVFVTCGDWDLRTALRKQCDLSGIRAPRWMQQWLNIKDEYRQHYGAPPHGMEGLLHALGLQLEGRHHSGIDDTRNIARCLQTMVSDGWAPAPHLLRQPAAAR